MFVIQEYRTLKQNTMETDKRLKQAISKKSKKGIAKSLKQNTMEKRKIESAEPIIIESVPELINAWMMGVDVGEKHPYSELLYVHECNLDANLQRLKIWVQDKVFYYNNKAVEVVELWFDELQRGAMVAEVKVQEWSTHKQTQILQNGEIIWTKTEKI